MKAFWSWLGNTELAFQIGATWLFPFVESLHVLFVELVEEHRRGDFRGDVVGSSELGI